MSPYAYLSKPDPEIAALLSKLSSAFPPTRARVKNVIQPFLASQLPAETEYRVIEHKVAVQDGEINVRCVIPTSAEDGKTFPLLVWTHGGGFMLGDLDMDDYPLKMLSVAAQIVTVNVEYRLAPQHIFPTQLNDSYAALKWAAQQSKLLSTDLSKGFLVGGISSGANLAAVLAHRTINDIFFADKPLTGQVLGTPHVLYHPVIPEQYRSWIYSLEQNKDAPIATTATLVRTAAVVKAPPSDPEYAPIYYASQAGLPPAYVQIAGMDPVRDEGLLYAKLLHKAGVPTKVDMYQGVPHGFANFLMQTEIAARYRREFTEGVTWLLNQSKA